jgi:hypothetical protein
MIDDDTVAVKFGCVDKSDGMQVTLPSIDSIISVFQFHQSRGIR